MSAASYVIAAGSNRRGRHGSPAAEVRAALALIGGMASPVIASAPVGPSQRRYANAAAIVASDLEPPAMLAWLKRIERDFGRRSGRRWGGRVIDLDIVLWSRGCWASPGLVVPHPRFRERRFVLDPLVRLVPRWRDPVTGRSLRQLRDRLTARRPLPRPERDGWGP